MRAFAFGLIYALLMALAFFLPQIAWVLVFAAPLPLIALARNPIITPSRAGLYAALGSSPWWLLTHIWIGGVSRAGLFPLVVMLSVYTMLFVWVLGRITRRFPRLAVWLIAPVVWVGVEFLRGRVVLDGYAFYLLAHPLIESPGSLFAQPASVLGTYFVSGLIVLVGALAWTNFSLAIGPFSATQREPAFALGPGSTVRPKRKRGLSSSVGRWGAAGVLLLLWFGFGFLRSSPTTSDRTLRVGVVQSNIAQDNRMRWTFKRRYAAWLVLRALSIQAASHRPDLIVWPEGVFPGQVLDPASLDIERVSEAVWPMRDGEPGPEPPPELADFINSSYVADELRAFQRAIGIPMVIGATALDNLRIVQEGQYMEYESDAVYNTAFMLNHGRIQRPWYDKLQLAPFGEVMPLISNWAWLEKQLLAFGANGMTFGLSAADEPALLELPSPEGTIHLATPICFEATVSNVCRRLVYAGGRRRADLLVTITNDGWFKDWTPAREHFLMASRWRCVELATPMVRAANTGISGVYDARGRVISEKVEAGNGSWAVGNGGEGDSEPRASARAVGKESARSSSRDRLAGVLTASIPLATGSTPYARIGDAFGWLCLLMTAGLGAATLRRTKG